MALETNHARPVKPIGNRQLAIGKCLMIRTSPFPCPARASRGSRQSRPRDGVANSKSWSAREIRRTGLLTESAEHAARRIEVNSSRTFFAARLAATPPQHPWNDVYQFRQAQRAKITSMAKRVVCFRIHVQSARRETRRHVGTHRRILLGVNPLPGD